MLTYLSIRNFTLVEQLALDVDLGMTAITGETGTGKSIVLEALALALGGRASGDCVRTGADKADICAHFSLSALPQLQQWLVTHEWAESGDEASECLLRRVITREGRSRSYINGQVVTLQQLRRLSGQLVVIHSQHAHQSLLKKEVHRQLLDQYGRHCDLADKVRENYRQWQRAQQQLTQLQENTEAIDARYQLLRYQVEELRALGLTDGEVTTLEEERQRLADGEKIQQHSHQLRDICDGDDHCLRSLLNHALQLLMDCPALDQPMKNAQQLLGDALIHVEEAVDEIRESIDTVELNPERLQQVEERLSALYDIARKHRASPDKLVHLQQQLSAELAAISDGDNQLKHLREQSRQAEADYRRSAIALSKRRQSVATRLAANVNKYLQQLGMNNACLVVQLPVLPDSGSSQGLEEVVLLISTNPEQAPRPLAKVVSGGELSRISLAIQVATTETSTIPTLIFDEVDVGVGGATADIIGNTLAALGRHCQVLCVTHLAQVASKADHHWHVSKQVKSKATQTMIETLQAQSKIEEIARMISGSELTDQSLAHARQMLER